MNLLVTSTRYLILFALIALANLTSCKKNTDVTQQFHKDGDVVPLFLNNPHGVNMVILGDGFVKRELAVGGTYDFVVNNLTDYFFSIPPYKQYKQYFNVYVVYAESNESGAFIGYYPGSTRTRFNTYYDSYNYPITRSLLIGNLATGYSYVEKAVPINEAQLILMVVNDNRYGGSGGPIAVVASGKLSQQIMIHEIGHSFGGLGDEYVEIDSVGYDLNAIASLPNIDTTADPNKVKWAHFLNNTQYDSTVGIFEGAFNHAKGAFRPSNTSIMQSLYSQSYNAPSREAIVKHIDNILGIAFDQDDFYKNDVREPN